ncbi:hypothetical protein SprV_0702427200 [Sparganum proliferum]
MFSSPGHGSTPSAPETSADSFPYDRIADQQNDIQRDLAKLADLMKQANRRRPLSRDPKPGNSLVEPTTQTALPVAKGEDAPARLYTIASMEQNKGKGSSLSPQNNNAQVVRFNLPQAAMTTANTSNQCTDKLAETCNQNIPTGQYIRIQADPATGEPIISIFDAMGNSQVACAYLTKDFKLDIDFKLWEVNKERGMTEVGPTASRASQVKSPSPAPCEAAIPPAPPSIRVPSPSPTSPTQWAGHEGTPPLDCNWFIWRVDNFAEVEEKCCGDWCEPFYLGQPGYRMQAKLEFSTYMFGAYIRLICGDYDACLQWPFDRDIYFSILDQTGCANHIVRVLRPYPCDSDEKGIWDRPRAGDCEKQIGWGLPDLGLRSLFCTKMGKPSPYLRNGTLYIQISLGKTPPCTDVC